MIWLAVFLLHIVGLILMTGSVIGLIDNSITASMAVTISVLGFAMIISSHAIQP